MKVNMHEAENTLSAPGEKVWKGASNDSLVASRAKSGSL